MQNIECNYRAAELAFACVALWNSNAKAEQYGAWDCSKAIEVYASLLGTTYSIHRGNGADKNCAIIRYHNRDCVNDGFTTTVYVGEDNIITWEN